MAMEFVSLSDGLTDPELGQVNVENGTLPLSWYSLSESGVMNDGNVPVFEVTFRLKNEPFELTNLKVSNSVISSQLYSAGLKVNNIGSYGGEVRFAGQDVLGIGVHPNPFNTDIMLTFELAEEQNVSVVLTNSIGAKIATNEANFAKGEHELELSDWLFDGNDLASGMYWVTIETDRERYIRKIIKR